MFTSIVLNNIIFRQMVSAWLWKSVIQTSNILKRIIASGCRLIKEIDQLSWTTTRRNLKHIPQTNGVHFINIPSALPFSWEVEQFYILWRFTVIRPCICNMLNSAEFHSLFLFWSFYRSLRNRAETENLWSLSRILRILKDKQTKEARKTMNERS